jgi:hypothetical protein
LLHHRNGANIYWCLNQARTRLFSGKRLVLFRRFALSPSSHPLLERCG